MTDARKEIRCTFDNIMRTLKEYDDDAMNLLDDIIYKNYIERRLIAFEIHSTCYQEIDHVCYSGSK